jgi:monovalent cation:H+ antiporter-2, CPA2 family
VRDSNPLEADYRFERIVFFSLPYQRSYMPPHTTLIATIAASLGVAFLFGLGAARLRLPPIVGYLLAGIAVGPFTPGVLLDSGVVSQGAELGVILLMFGVGLHFSFRDLMIVRRVVIPGALIQLLITGSVGAYLAYTWGISAGGALVVGICVAVASTVVLLKGLEAQDRLDSPDGRLAVGWLVVEDLTMVLVLVMLPAIAPLLSGDAAAAPLNVPALSAALAVSVGKVLAFAALMLLVGRRVVPWLLEHVARVGSRELFTLAVLATALGIATMAAEVFGVSFALGAFFAGAVVSESELSHRAATDALPMQDAFAVLFFLSIGMLFDPRAVLQSPMQVVALVTVILVCKFVTSYTLMRLFKQTQRSALIIGASLAQIGEFSFIVAGLGVSLGLLARDTQALIVAAAIVSITLNQPLLNGVRLLLEALERRSARQRLGQGPEFRGAERAVAPHAKAVTSDAVDPFDFSQLHDHVLVIGHGRVGTTISEALQRESARYVIVDEQERVVAGLRSRGEKSVFGDATRADVLHRAGVENARLIVVTAPEPIRARRIVEVAREANPAIVIAVRTHSATEQVFFEELVNAPGVSGRAIYAEREAALSLAHYALQVLGRSDDQADVVIDAMRNSKILPTESFPAIHTREFRAMMAPDPNHPTVKEP